MTSNGQLSAETFPSGTAPAPDNPSKSGDINVEVAADSGDSSCVQVAVRIRPMLPTEEGSTQCIEALASNVSKGTLTVVRLGGESGPKFTFDEVFPGSCTQLDVYENRVVPLVLNCLEGFNATILAYGQTGSGKTHTIMGPSSSNVADVVQDEVHAGLLPRAIRSIFTRLESMRQSTFEDGNPRGKGTHERLGINNNDSPSSSSFEYEVRIQFLEVYGENLRDLLATSNNSGNKLTIRDVGLDEPEVLGASQHKVDSAEEALLLLTRGMFRRVTGATNMNESSSRSHAILSLVVEQSVVVDDEGAAENDNGNIANNTSARRTKAQHVEAKVSKFNFVDLAGSERQKRTGAVGQRLKEAIDINSGLLVLGNVISALGDPQKKGKTFVPYRDSKLTRLLKGSLGGNHKTLMVACVSPSSNNMEESLNCLRYANRAKNIQNHAVVNVDSTTKLISDLRGKIQVLALDLLKAHELAREGNDGSIEAQSTFSIEVLKTLASGGEGSYQSIQAISPQKMSRTTINSLSASKPLVSQVAIGATMHHESAPSSTPPRYHQHLSDNQGGNPFLRSAFDFEGASHSWKAEKEAHRIQVEAAGHLAHLDVEGKSSVVAAIQQAFVARATEYEREIAELRARLYPGSNDESNLSVLSDHEQLNIGDERPPYLPKFPPRTPLRRGRSSQQATYPERSESPELSRLRAQVFGSMSQSNHLDAEVEAEEKARDALTKKYLERSTSEDGTKPINTKNDDSHNNSIALTGTEGQTLLDALLHDGDDGWHDAAGRSHQQLEADLYELSNSIVVKEELIHQLQSSQEKYEAMREYYEGKLKEMEELLHHRECESEKLAEELRQLGSGHGDSGALEERLRQKKEHIADLKKKQGELARLTSVASHNEQQVSKLRKEVVEMKHRKVTLQKQLKDERKTHMMEMQKLKNEVTQKDREIVKIKKASDQKAFEAEKAQQIAKTRLEQMTQLKAKYKETEKSLRMQTVKRGVMEKAGLDPVIVGRRRTAQVSKPSKPSTEETNVDFDALRDFFDQKVADVGRREALAEKIAQEWEEHLELTLQKDEISKNDQEDLREALTSINSQINYKEERIRQLASRLGKHQNASAEKVTSEFGYLLFDKSFEDVAGTSPADAAKSASMVLFGMVVRERRRIASLARTASSLDERVQAAEAAAVAKDSAFRAYVNEQRNEVAMLTQNQQEQILSLMDMVRDGDAVALSHDATSEVHGNDHNPEGRGSKRSEGHTNPTLLVLANERISVLERQLRQLRSENEAIEHHRQREEDARSELHKKAQECEILGEEIITLRTTLRQVRDAMKNEKDFVINTEGFKANALILDLVTKALHPTEVTSTQKSKTSRSRISQSITPRKLRSDSFADSTDSEGVPDWADGIMADLAIIAEGKMPASLLESAAAKGVEELSGDESVFDRLANPTAFTGVQKQKQTKSKPKTNLRSSSQPPSSGQRQRKLISKQVADSLDKVEVPTVQEQQKKDVFDRLLSPSNLTGTQKQRFREKKGRKNSGGNGSGEVQVREGQTLSNEHTNPTRGIRAKSEATIDDDILDDLLSGGDAFGNSKTEPFDHLGTASRKRGDYAKQDVFERLQTTTTAAYAVKQHENIAEKMLHDLLDTEDAGNDQCHKHDMTTPAFDRIDGYVKQDVFERLQKTSTQSFAASLEADKDTGKKFQLNHDHATTTRNAVEHTSKTTLRTDSPTRTRTAMMVPPEPNPDYVRQNVFERLTKTPTLAFKGKFNS